MTEFIVETNLIISWILYHRNPSMYVETQENEIQIPDPLICAPQAVL